LGKSAAPNTRQFFGLRSLNGALLKKKMSESRKNLVNTVGYRPAVVRKKSEVYVEYYILNPISHTWNRKRIRVNHVSELKKDKVRYADQIAKDINRKLENGWNPYIEHDAPRAFTLLSEALDTHVRSKKKEFRPATERMYRSILTVLNPWLLRYFQSPDIYCIQVDRLCAANFMQYLLLGRNVGFSTFNNYLAALNSIFNWMVEYSYISANPFAGIKKKTVNIKRRMYLTEKERQKVKAYLELHNRHYLRVVLLSYFTLLRRLEITKVKVSDVNLRKGLIKVWGDNTKNRKDAIITIPGALRPYLEQMNLDECPQNWYLFGPQFFPSAKPVTDKKISDEWLKMRKALKLSARVQFMSLRDTGIKNLLASGVQIDDVMKHARHHSLEVTKTYLIHDDGQIIESVKNINDF
jgi:integrase/recombinase XerD